MMGELFETAFNFSLTAKVGKSNRIRGAQQLETLA